MLGALLGLFESLGVRLALVLLGRLLRRLLVRLFLGHLPALLRRLLGGLLTLKRPTSLRGLLAASLRVRLLLRRLLSALFERLLALLGGVVARPVAGLAAVFEVCTLAALR